MNIKNNINVAKKVLLRRFSGILAVAVVSVISLAGLVSLNAWGPADRATFTIAKPASYVTFNSITDNPAYGDERNFFRIKEASANSSTYTDEMKVEPGKTYRGYIYYHNNASKVLNDAAHEYKGVALNTSLRVNLPNSVTPGSKARINAYISADNANPKQVWDEAYMTADSAVAIRYVPGSAKLTNRGGANGSVLADSFLTTGALIGYDKLDG